MRVRKEERRQGVTDGGLSHGDPHACYESWFWPPEINTDLDVGWVHAPRAAGSSVWTASALQGIYLRSRDRRSEFMSGQACRWEAIAKAVMGRAGMIVCLSSCGHGSAATNM